MDLAYKDIRRHVGKFIATIAGVATDGQLLLPPVHRPVAVDRHPEGPQSGQNEDQAAHARRVG